jgi:hypothetical protein
VALREELALPGRVTGPRDLAPLAREAAIWAAVGTRRRRRGRTEGAGVAGLGTVVRD